MAPSSPHFLCWVALTSVEWRKPEQGSQAFHREIVGTFLLYQILILALIE